MSSLGERTLRQYTNSFGSEIKGFSLLLQEVQRRFLFFLGSGWGRLIHDFVLLVSLQRPERLILACHFAFLFLFFHSPENPVMCHKDVELLGQWIQGAGDQTGKKGCWSEEGLDVVSMVSTLIHSLPILQMKDLSPKWKRNGHSPGSHGRHRLKTWQAF